MIALLLLAEIHCVPPLLGQKFGPSVDESKKALHTRARSVQRVSLPLWRRGRGERPRPRPSVRAPHRRGAAVPHTALSSRCVCGAIQLFHTVHCRTNHQCLHRTRAGRRARLAVRHVLHVEEVLVEGLLLVLCCVIYTLLFALYWAAAASTLDRVLTRARTTL